MKLPSVVDGFASEGIIQFFFEETGDEKGFNIYILDESNRAEVYHHCEGSKEELVRDVSRFYSSSHDRFTYGSSFINFNLPQFYQIVKTDGRAQVIPFRTQPINTVPPANQIMTHRYCSSIFRAAPGKLPGRRSPLHINFTQLRYRDLRIWFTGGGLRWQMRSFC